MQMLLLLAPALGVVTTAFAAERADPLPEINQPWCRLEFRSGGDAKQDRGPLRREIVRRRNVVD